MTDASGRASGSSGGVPQPIATTISAASAGSFGLDRRLIEQNRSIFVCTDPARRGSSCKVSLIVGRRTSGRARDRRAERGGFARQTVVQNLWPTASAKVVLDGDVFDAKIRIQRHIKPDDDLIRNIVGERRCPHTIAANDQV